MQLTNAVKTFVLCAMNVPKRTANTTPTISARVPHTIPATACLVRGLVADLPEVLRPGQHARHRDREQEHQREPASPGLAGIRDLRQHLQQAGDFVSYFICAGQSGSRGMRHWHRRLLASGQIRNGHLDRSGREAALANQVRRGIAGSLPKSGQAPRRRRQHRTPHHQVTNPASAAAWAYSWTRPSAASCTAGNGPCFLRANGPFLKAVIQLASFHGTCGRS
jgi:hypothetical protein